MRQRRRPPETEAKLQERLIKDIKDKYGDSVWLFKTNEVVRVGVPDLILCFFGHFVAIEIKRPQLPDDPNKTGFYIPVSPREKLQAYNIEKIFIAGGSAFFARDYQYVMDKLERILKSMNLFEAHKIQTGRG